LSALRDDLVGRDCLGVVAMPQSRYQDTTLSTVNLPYDLTIMIPDADFSILSNRASALLLCKFRWPLSFVATAISNDASDSLIIRGMPSRFKEKGQIR